MKDKKKITAVLMGITSALRKGYDLLSQADNLPQVPDTDLPGLSLHIVKALQQELIQINENAQFEGLSYEEIDERKKLMRDEQIQQMQAQAAEDLKRMKAPEPELEPESDETNPAQTDDEPEPNHSDDESSTDEPDGSTNTDPSL